MTDFFLAVGSKSIKSKEAFNNEGSKPELLLEAYKAQGESSRSPAVIDNNYKQWCNLLFAGFNVVIHGCQSKFKLLETFKQRYLDSGQLPDLSDDAPMNGFTMLNVTTVRMHGLVPVSFESFINGLFGIQDSSKVKPEQIMEFLEKARRKRQHYVFLMHSFDSLYRECKPVCDLIFQLYRHEPKYMHMILSADHVNSGKILNQLKTQHQLIFYYANGDSSFFLEKTHAFRGIEDMGEQARASDRSIATFEGQLNLQTIKDVYQALQAKYRSVMVHIIKEFVQRNQSIEDTKMIDKQARESTAKTPRRSDRNKADSTELDFNKLLEHCESTFLLRRANVLRNYLGELEDHGIIALDETGNKIRCLISINTCKRFLKEFDSF